MRRSPLAVVFARFSLVVLTVAVLLTAARFVRAEEHDAAAPEVASSASLVPVVVPVVSPSAASSTSSTASAASGKVRATGELKVRDKAVFTFRASRGDREPLDRAKAAQAALDSLLAHGEQLGEVTSEEAQGTAVIYVGKTPIITLGAEDVEATGEASLGVLTAQVTARLSEAVSSERKRSAIATTVFSASLLVFSALIAFWLLGRVTAVAEKLRSWMADNPDHLGAVKLGNIELVSAGATRGGSSIALTLGYRLTQFAIGYAWLIFGLSLFASTRGYTERLTGLMISPLSALATRIGSALPVFFVAGIAVLAVSVLVRFIGLFFDSVARGDTKIMWLARDLARPTSALLRFGVVVMSLVLASPLITGESDGVLSRVGLVALVAVALASTPLLASATIGAVLIYGRRLKKGELVEFGGRAGRVNEVRLLDVRLEDASACDVSIPHLLGLFHPTRVHRHPPLASIDVVVDPTAPQAEVEKALLGAARSISSRGRVDLVYLDGGGAHWRVHSATHRGDTTLGRAVQDALATLGVGLGRVGAVHREPPPPARQREEGTTDT